MKRALTIEIAAVAILVILALVLRLYKLDNPVADWHSWRQADTASVTREFTKKIELLTPRYHDLSNIPSGKENPAGYRMVEWPLYNLLHLGVYRLLPQLGLDAAGRLTSTIASLFSLVFLYLIIRHLSGRAVALWAAFLFALLPFSVYYSRVILPEPLMIALSLASFYFFLLSFDKHRPYYFWQGASAIILALALLVKPYALFFILPYFYFLLTRPLSLKKRLASLLFFALSLAPLLLWRTWIARFPEGIPASNWLYNINGIRLRPAWFRWLFAERLGKLIFGYYGLIPFGLGLLFLTGVETVYLLWFIGILFYFVIFAGGNVTHDYYQAITIPTLVSLAAVGWQKIVSLKSAPLFLRLSLITGLLGLSLFLSWYEIRGYYQINNWPIVEAGKEVDRLVPPNALVIASYNGDTAFLYQTRRSGWPAITTDLQTMVTQYGATHYVSVNYDDQTNKIANWSGNKIIAQTKNYVIVALTAPTQP